MKKGFLSVICFMLLTGCGSKSVIDEKTASKLSEDTSVMDFYLDGKKYTLPESSLNDFIKNGWKSAKYGWNSQTADGKDIVLEEVQLKPKYYFEIRLEKADTSLEIQVMNDETETIGLLDEKAHVKVVTISYGEGAEPLSVVTKGGITLQSSTKDAEAQIAKLNKKNKDLSEDDSSFSTELRSKDGMLSLLSFYDNDGDVTSLTIGDEYSVKDGYLAYESTEDAGLNISDLKSEISSESVAKVEGQYDSIVKSESPSYGIHMKFEIIGEGEVSSTYIDIEIATGRAYLAKGSDGNLYALEIKNAGDKAYIPWVDLVEGDQIEVWGKITNLLKTEEKDVMIPNVVTYIIEKNGTMIYRDDK